MACFNLEVSYSQISIFDKSIEHPFNDWTERHVSQGFAWRQGSVSFRTLVESGVHMVEVEVESSAPLISNSAKRAIEVPFEVPPEEAIEVASISDSVSLTLPAGPYTLRCEFLGAKIGGVEHVRLVFFSADLPHFAVVRADENLIISGELLKTAEHAPS